MAILPGGPAHSNSIPDFAPSVVERTGLRQANYAAGRQRSVVFAVGCGGFDLVLDESWDELGKRNAAG
jgi:hypothetical protein